MLQMDKNFPNESADYRDKRDELLQAEMALRAQVERVAEMRRGLPMGGLLKEDYVFDGLDDSGAPTRVRMSELFAPDKPTLIVYSLMFGPTQDVPCPMCACLVDGFNATAPHLTDRVNFAVVAKSPIDRIMQFARGHGWTKARVLSSANNTYNVDYWAEREGSNAPVALPGKALQKAAQSGQMPMLNVFVKRQDGIHHFWGSEMLWKSDQQRHLDMVWPLWNMLDLTPEGRGADWYPKLSYEHATVH